MKKKARGHHVYSRCYLKGFTKSRKRDGRLNVLILRENKILLNQSLDKFGKKRDFNRISLEGFDPDSLESGLADFENEIDKAIRNVESTYIFEDEDRTTILNMMTLFGIRNLLWRERHDMFISTVMKLQLDILSTAKIGSIVNGTEITPQLKLDLEKAKAAMQEGKYKITYTQNSHIKFELDAINDILPYFFNRKWTLAIASEGSNFITSDHPVILIWKDNTRYAIPNPISPGFGSPNSLIIFPLSRDLALIGDFEGKEGSIYIDEEFVARINYYVLFFAKEQIYTPDTAFYFITKGGELAKFKEEYLEELKGVYCGM